MEKKKMKIINWTLYFLLPGIETHKSLTLEFILTIIPVAPYSYN